MQRFLRQIVFVNFCDTIHFPANRHTIVFGMKNHFFSICKKSLSISASVNDSAIEQNITNKITLILVYIVLLNKSLALFVSEELS